MKPKILIFDDDSAHRKMLEAVLSAQGYEIRQAEDGQTAITAVEKRFYDLILMDVRMTRVGGIEALKRIKEIIPGIPVIIMTAYASVSTSVEALKSGAYDYLTKPLDIDELKILINKALQHKQLEKENIYLREQLGDRFDFSKIIGQGSVMRKLLETIAIVAPT